MTAAMASQGGIPSSNWHPSEGGSHLATSLDTEGEVASFDFSDYPLCPLLLVFRERKRQFISRAFPSFTFRLFDT